MIVRERESEREREIQREREREREIERVFITKWFLVSLNHLRSEGHI